MTKIFLLLVLLTTAFSIRLKIGSKIDLAVPYELRCEQNIGQVIYSASDLPSGVRLNRNKLEIYDASLVEEQTSTVKVRVRDELGDTDEKIVIVILRHQKAEQKSSLRKAEESVKSSEDIPTNKILDDLLIPSSVSADYEYPNEGYPTGNFPTGVNKDLFNFVPEEIRSKQAVPTQKDRNVITADDVKSHVIFERQLNAAKAIANLLAIIKQATANKNEAERQVDRRTKLFEEATAERRKAQENVLKAENDLARLKKGIETVNNEISEIRQKLNNLTGEKDKKRLERESIREGIEEARKNLNTVNFQLNDKKRELQQLEEDMTDKGIQCQQLQSEALKVQEDLGNKKIQRATLDMQINDGQKKVDESEEKVNDLKRKLIEAEGELQRAKSDLDALNEKGRDLDEQIQKLKNKLADLSDRIFKCGKELEKLKKQIDQLKNNVIPELERKKISIQSEIDNLNAKFDDLSSMLDEIPTKIADYEGKINRAFENLRHLRSQLFTYQNNLRNAYTRGNLANEKAARAKSNLDSAVERFKKEQSIIDEATKNLQIARVEKENADQAVEDHLQEGADILPFASAPGETGFEPMGGGEYAIKSWEEYVETAYGKGVKPLFVGDLKSLYSFDMGYQDKKEEDCENKALKAVSGYILQVFDDSFMMITEEGEKFVVKLNGCTKSFANMKGYNLDAGDIAVLKGIKGQADNEIIATQLTCIRR